MSSTFLRPDGLAKVTGSGRYTADLAAVGMLAAKFRYADHAHAKILSIDTSAAERLPGVFAIITHHDVPQVRYGGMVQDRLLFAKDMVRFEGDIIAAVAASTPEQAQAAAEAIEVTYEVLPAVTDYVAAIEPGATLVHEHWADYESEDDLGRDGNILGRAHLVQGDAETAMQDADVIVRGIYDADASQGAPIEPRAILAQWEGEQVTIHTSTQVPFAARSGVAQTLQLSESQVRIVVPLLGGGFGSKCDFHFEAHIAALAKAAGRPVRLVFSRKEEFFAPDHRREGMRIELRTGVKRDGTLVAREARIIMDGGAYCGEGGFFAGMAVMHGCGPYTWQALSIQAFLAYSTNQPSSSIRAPTAPQICWAVEQHMDAIAAEIGMDPAQLRMQNLIENGSTGPTGQVFDSVSIKETLQAAMDMIGYGQDLPEDEGIGLACGWWPSIASPSGAYVKLNGDGTGTIITGAQENGSGSVMALPILAAEVLGMEPEAFSLTYQDTESGPWDMGSSGSQTTINNGRAVIDAAMKVRDQLLAKAARKLEIDVSDLELAEGHVRAKGAPDTKMSITELAGGSTLFLGHGSGPVPRAPQVNSSGCVGLFGMDAFLAPQLITQAARVKVDRATGVVRVIDFAAAHDSGVILNRAGADGQVYGGVVMGIGQALMESTQFDDDSRQRNPGFLDYKLQTALDVPPIQVQWIESVAQGAGPQGSKGVGEPPSVPTAGAVANAIRDAVGVAVHQLPMTAPRLWQALHTSDTTQAGEQR